MAHELEIVNGEAKMAYAVSGGVPWHGLGVEVSDDLTPDEMLKAAGLNWKVRELSTFAEMTINGQKKRLPTGMKALVRETDGRVLTQVGKNWHPVQNEEAFTFFNEFIEMGEMKMHTAGSLKNGNIVWALAKVDDSFEAVPGDLVESHLLFTNPHQYGKVLDVRFSPTRVVCNNTLTLALSEQSNAQVSLNHRRKFDAEEVKELLGIAKFKMTNYAEASKALAKTRMTDDVMKTYFGDLLGRNDKNELSRNALRAMEVVSTQPGAEYGEGTAWSAYNAVTYLVDHELGRTADTRLQSSWYGVNRKLKTDALNKALGMV